MAKIPFGYLPSHWGLKGKTREIAKAEYELSGLDLELKLLELNNNLDLESREKKRLEILYRFKKFTEKEYLQKLVDLIDDDLGRGIAQLEHDKKFKAITELEYEKRLADLKKEPWVKVLSMDFGKENPSEGSFELDWNEYFVENLKKEGYKGISDEAIVNLWFMEVCRNVAMDEFSGTGDFEADSRANLENMRRWQSEKEDFKGRKGYR